MSSNLSLRRNQSYPGRPDDEVEHENAALAFLCRMRRELRAPLTTMIGLGELLAGDHRDLTLEQRREYARFVAETGRHLLLLMDELADLARVEEGTLRSVPEPASVEAVSREVLRAVDRTAANCGITLNLDVGDTVPAVRADPLRLRQILRNLLSNAIKFNRAGGSATVTAQRVRDDRVMISVHDTGTGIDPTEHPRIFQMLNRPGPAYTEVDGTGLGLALSRRLAELMDGRMGFTSTPGEGSTFWVELPAA